MSDLSGHYQKWLGSTTTNRHGVAALDLATVSVCDQLLVDLYLLMTDVPGIARIALVAPKENKITHLFQRLF